MLPWPQQVQPPLPQVPTLQPWPGQHATQAAESGTNATASSKSPNVGGYTAGTLDIMMHDYVQWNFKGQQALKQAQE